MLHVKTHHKDVNGEPIPPPVDAVLSWPFPTDAFQNHAFQALHDGRHVLVTAHTGSGKTLVAEYGIAYALAQKKRVIYTSPIKALSNQVYGDLKRKYPEWNIGIRTGDIDERSSEADVVIMTTEILRNMLAGCSEGAGIGTDVGVVVFDEVHWIKDKARGAVWEESILRMPSEVQMVMLSATLPDAERFGAWISRCSGRDVVLCPTSHRVVPLSFFVPTEDSRIKIKEGEGDFNLEAYRQAQRELTFTLPQLNDYVGRMKLPAMFFCFSKRKCQEYANAVTRSVVDAETLHRIDKTIDWLVRKFDNQTFMELQQAVKLRKLLLKGVGYHHAGLHPALKEIVQELFSQGLLQVLFVTETFAAGVNMPARTVVFTSLTKIDGEIGGFRYLYPEEFGQMAGRAGRRGMDTVGTVLLLPFHRRGLPTERDMRQMLCGQLHPIVSRFSVDLSFYLRKGTASLFDKSMRQEDVEAQHIHEAKTHAVLFGEDEKLKKVLVDLDRRYPEMASMYALYVRYHERNLSKRELKDYQRNVKPWLEVNVRAVDTYEKTKRRRAVLAIEMAQLQRQLGSLDDVATLELRAIDNYMQYVGFKSVDLRRAAAMVNEANPILVVELVVRGILLNAGSTASAITLLGTLVEYSPPHTQVATPTDVVPGSLYVQVRNLRQLAATFENEAERRQLRTLGVDWQIYDSLLPLTYAWLSGESPNFEQIRADNQFELYEGEFIRYMLKLNNLCKECIEVAEATENYELCAMLRDHQELAVRSIVMPQSLYVD